MFKLGRLSLFLFALGLFGCDHATKIAAEGHLAAGRVVPLVDGVLELKYAPNPDTAFSLLHRTGLPTPPWLLVAVSTLAFAAVLVAWFRRRSGPVVEHVGFALVAAGALGNVVDRAVRGYVVDFIHLTRWPIFNVADVAVVVGALLLVLCASSRKRALQHR